MFNKAKFDVLASAFAEAIPSLENPAFFPQEVVANFQQHWDIHAMDFLGMMDRSLLIGSDKWSLKFINGIEIMKLFIEKNEDMVRGMFQDLFHDEKDLTGRIGRFEYHCDLLLKEVQEERPNSLDHHHGDKHMIFYYLFLRFPMQYAPWQMDDMQKVLVRCGAPSPIHNHEVIRYVKVCRIFLKFLSQDDSIVEQLSTRLDDPLSFRSAHTLTSLFLHQKSEN